MQPGRWKLATVYSISVNVAGKSSVFCRLQVTVGQSKNGTENVSAARIEYPFKISVKNGRHRAAFGFGTVSATQLRIVDCRNF